MLAPRDFLALLVTLPSHDDDVARPCRLPRALDRLDPTLDRIVREPKRARGGRGSQGVLDVEGPAELELDPPEVAVRSERDGVGDLRRQPRTVFVADVDHGRGCLCEQTALGFE